VRPVEANCDDERLHVTLSDGRAVAVPLWWYPRLLNADVASRNPIEVMPLGLHWPNLDEDISVDSILGGEMAPGARDPAEETVDISKLLEIVRHPPVASERNEAPLVAGARCPIDYRSMIYERVWRAYFVGERLPDIDYERFFAATDTLLDVADLLHVAENGIWPLSKSAGQLWMYGALQALVVQQEACEQLLHCFGVANPPDAAQTFLQVNDLRISVVGHPHNHTRNKNLTYKGCTFLAHRSPGSRTRFEVGTYADFKEFVSRTIDVPELVARQQIAIQQSLSLVWNAIKNDPRFDPKVEMDS
jgi:hypothetical protein